MTDLLFTSSEATSGGVVDKADLALVALRARCIAPSDTGIAASLVPTLTTRQEDSAARDIEIQVSAVSDFASTVWTTTLTAVAALTDVSIACGVTLTANTKYWWRVRAVASGPVYGSWETRSFTVNLTANVDYATSHINVGIGTSLVGGKDDYEPVHVNVGVLLVQEKIDYEAVLLNVGVLVAQGRDGYEYAHVGDVNTLVPDPDIWFLMPTSGRAGDGFTIIGSGFGDLQATYTGTVEVDLNDGFGWQTIGVITWQLFPADPDMYGPNREISASKIDPEHGEISVLVPSGALPPGMRVRVRTSA